MALDQQKMEQLLHDSRLLNINQQDDTGEGGVMGDDEHPNLASYAPQLEHRLLNGFLVIDR